jgi:hypothetical protein
MSRPYPTPASDLRPSGPPVFTRPSPLASRPKRGFALLITITLLAFLVLLLVSLASLTRVETQVANNNQTLAQARQNALMALNIALGQLQKYTGPDQRVTATADVLIPSAANITNTTTASAARTALDAYWSASRNRHWTGVWQNTNTTPVTSLNSKTPVVYNPIPSPTPVWLVSGSELPASTYDPKDALTNLGINSAATDDTIKNAAGDVYRLLVGKNTTAITAASELDRLVTVPQISIKSTSAAGLGGADTTVGHYAWWVGDEGVKARANQVDTYADTASATNNRIRLQSAQRPAIEAMTTTGTDGLGSTYPANGADVPKVTSLNQLGLLNTAATFQTQLHSRFHDLTTSSRGVLADVKNGGLKRDLSYVLSRTDTNSLRTALNTTPTGAPAFTPAPLNTHNVPLSAVTTPYAAGYPDLVSTYFTLDFINSAGGPGIFDYGPTWEQLWSFYNMGNRTTDTPAGVFDTTGTVATARSVNDKQSGLYPLMMQGKVFYRLRIVGTAVWVDIIPQVVLANPYNVTLAGTYIVKLNVAADPGIKIRVGHYAPDPVSGDLVFTYSAVDPAIPSGHKAVNGFMGKTKLVVNSTGIAPGEAQIFTLNANTTIPDMTTVTQVTMANDYDPTTALTYDTGITITSPETHAVLYTTSTGITAELYVNTDTNTDTRVNFTNTYRFSGSGMAGSGNLVDPVASGTQQGGGIWFTYCDGACLGPQQSPFYQINYRAMLISSAGYSTPNNHPLQWVHSSVKYGVLGTNDNTPHPLLAANLMRPAGSLTTTRWALINNGEGSDYTVAPATIGGPSSTVGFKNLLYDLPRPDQPITSLGQLQHFNTAGHATSPTVNGGAGVITHQWQVNYPISNSYPNPRVPRDQVFDLRGEFSYNYDGSYLWNDALWDRFYFSSFPKSGPFDFASASDKLINARYTPFRDTTTVPLNDPTKFRGLFLAAQNLLADGAFNINSTSIDAWKAVFSSLKNVPIGSETTAANLSAPFARTLVRNGGTTGAKAGNTENAWTGFRNLTTTEINSLAEEMVMQVRRRGPFLSMGEFVNRRLTAGRPLLASPNVDPFGLGLSGALQSAIDKVLNKTTDIPTAPFSDKTKLPTNNAGYNLVDADYPMASRISGFPGYLLQGDVLSSLGPTLTARSDTFTIRTYGDVVNPVTQVVEGRAWCEAVVQRTPDYVSSINAPEDSPTGVNATFGRRYKIVSFRWLSPNDV